MSLREYAEKWIYDKGVFEKDAHSIVEAAQTHPLLEAMEGRWADPITDYPRAMLAVLLTSLRVVAHEWISQHQPQAWYRNVFAPEAVTA